MTLRPHRPGPPILALVLAAGAAGQCPDPAIYELGGYPGPVCVANINYQAVARGHFVSIERTPLFGNPSVTTRIALDRPAVHMHTEVLGRIWATDGSTIYGLNTST